MNRGTKRKNAYTGGLFMWALAFGCLIGSGCFRMPGTVFLPNAGPIGSVLGIAISAGMALIILVNYATLAEQHPEYDASYQFIKHILGMDHAFLAVWALIPAYLTIIWTNALAVSQFGRFLFGDALKLGFHYSLAGTVVYLGEALSFVLILGACALLLLQSRRASAAMITVFSAALFVSICALFIGVVIRGGTEHMVSPPFSASASALPGTQILGIIALAPWLYVGFETVTHAAKETGRPGKRIFPVGATAIVCAMACYIMMVLVGAVSSPAAYRSWESYIADLPNTTGISQVPVFYNVSSLLGDARCVLPDYSGVLRPHYMCPWLLFLSGQGQGTSVGEIHDHVADDVFLPVFCHCHVDPASNGS